MKNRAAVQQELNELSPFLAKIKAQGTQPDVPEHYFQALPNQIWEQIKLQPQPIVKQPNRWEQFLNYLQLLLQPRLALSLATFVILLAAGIYFIQIQTKPSVNSQAELTADEITDYINDNLQEFDTDLLIEASTDASGSILPEGSLEGAETDEMMEELIEDMEVEDLDETM